MNSNEPIRLDKYLAHTGTASRREAKTLIAQGFVLINGKKATSPGQAIHPHKDMVELVGAGKKSLQNKETYLVYKPRGVACTPDKQSGKTVFDIFPKLRHLSTVGRLDKDSEGLLLMSNDGLVTKAVTDRSHPSEKEYVVSVREDILPWMIERFITGTRIEGGYTTKRAQAERIDRHTFKIILREGKKHQIRRMANAVGLTISSLKRTRINSLTLGGMRPGQAKPLAQKQIDSLRDKVTIRRLD